MRTTSGYLNIIIHASICEGFGGETRCSPREAAASRPCARTRTRTSRAHEAHAFVPALASLRPQLRLPKSLISSTRSGW